MKKLIIGIMLLMVCGISSSTVQVQKAIENNIKEYNSSFNGDAELINKPEVSRKPHKIKRENEMQWINVIATAYTASADECGNSNGITASGTKVSFSRGTIAAPFDIPFETKIVIPELNKTFIVEDRGNKKYIRWINKSTLRIDVYLKTKAEAKEFGVKKLKGYLIK